jgi:hypothetical protein
VSVAPAAWAMLVNDLKPFLSNEVDTDCNSAKFYYDVTTGAGWLSNLVSVATVDNLLHKGQVKGQGGGSAGISADWTGIRYTLNHITDECDEIVVGKRGSGTDNVVTVSISGPVNVPLRASGSTGPNSINLTATGTPSGGTYSWSTTSSKVTLSNTTSATAVVTSASASSAVGDVPVKVTYTYNGKSSNVTKNVTVVKPISLSKTSDSANPTGHTCDPNATGNTCQRSDFEGNGTYTSYLRNITYDIMDQFSPPRAIKGFALENSESYTQPSGPCAGGPIITGPASFGDTLTDCFYFCSETCRTGGSCNVSATQTIKSNGFTVATKNINWTCSGASVP